MKQPCAKLERYLLGGSPDVERHELEKHLPTCSSCREEAQRFHEMRSAITTWAEASKLPHPTPAEAAELVARVTAGPRAPARRLGWGWAAMPVGVAAALLVLWGVTRHGTRSTDERKMASAPLVEALVLEGGAVIATIGGSSTLSAGEEGRLLATVEHDRVALGPKSDLRVLPARGSSGHRLQLLRGSVVCEAAPRKPDRPLIVESGRLEVVIVGTLFEVALLQPAGVRVAVGEGKVSVRESRARATEVAEGQTLIVEGDGTRRLSHSEPEVAAALRSAMALQPTSSPKPVATSPAEPPEPEPTSLLSTAAPRRPAARPLAHTPSRDLERWRGWLVSGRAPEAERAMEQYLNGHARDAEVWEALGEARRRAGAWARAVEAYGRVIEHGGADSANRARLKSAVVLQEKLAKPGDAARLLEEYLRQSAALRPLTPEAMLRMARCELALGHSAQAERLLREVVRKHHESAAASEARYLLGEGSAP